jgi:hypothetical protein
MSNFSTKQSEFSRRYNLIKSALDLGGQVVSVEVDESNPFVRHANGSRSDISRSTLSTAHIRPPFIEYRSGGSLFKVCKGGETSKVGGGKRGEIKGFSSDARLRLLRLIGSIRRDADLPLFITLTYPDCFPEPSESKRHLKIFWQRLNRLCPSHGSIWKLEPQERGAPHYHILTWGIHLSEVAYSIPSMWFDIAGGGDDKHLKWHLGLLGNGNVHCVQQVLSWRGVWSYASKYLGKTFAVSGWGDKWTGRYWGVVNNYNVPIGELIKQEVSINQAVQIQRYQRRFTGSKKVQRSSTIFCDADHWVNKLDVSPRSDAGEHGNNQPAQTGESLDGSNQT